ncbi:uncharacterized protein LOC143823041 [Paroedura picta]|uniref:uncharacterized protein LOC143823041 n=1 Tax=Paroedura picta TaxID=143630 RepID=UPI004057C44F
MNLGVNLAEFWKLLDAQTKKLGGIPHPKIQKHSKEHKAACGERTEKTKLGRLLPKLRACRIHPSSLGLGFIAGQEKIHCIEAALVEGEKLEMLAEKSETAKKGNHYAREVISSTAKDSQQSSRQGTEARNRILSFRKASCFWTC